MLFCYTSKRSQNLAYDGLANLLTLALDDELTGSRISYAYTLEVEVLYGGIIFEVYHGVVDTGGSKVKLEAAAQVCI